MKKYKRGAEIRINYSDEPARRTTPTDEQAAEFKRRRKIEDILMRRELARLDDDKWFESLE